MPNFELALLLKTLPKGELISSLKRVAQGIFDTGGIIRRIDNLGIRPTPYKISIHGKVHREASYWILEFTAPPRTIESLLESHSRDVDIVRSRVYKTPHDEKPFECTIEEEMKPPAYRPEVIKMVEEGQKKLQRKAYKFNTGLDYYPFQR